MKKLIFVLTAFCFLCFINPLKAQNTFAATGGNASGSEGSVSYSAGQIVYSTITSVNNSVAQGVQQPWEISVVTATEDAMDISLEIIVFPNPASEYLKLKTGNYELKNLYYKLYDLNGIQLISDRINAEETTIHVGNLKPSVYFLTIIGDGNIKKTFRIIKK